MKLGTRELDPPLQELIVPTGWLVEYHQVYAIEPRSHDTEDDIRWYFKEDLFSARYAKFDRLIDLGWYPEFQFDRGGFHLALYAGDFSGKLLNELRTRSLQAVVETIHEWCLDVSNGRI